MPQNSAQVLTVAQMRAAEAALIAGGETVDSLMLRAGQGAADYVWRMAAGRAVTVLCGPGNNGGDGYVVAETIRARGAPVRVVAAADPRSDAARNARAAYAGPVLGAEAMVAGEVLVDCLYGSGLTRALGAGDMALLTQLAQSHALRIAVDVPSGVQSDHGLLLGPDLPDWHLTLALGAWKPAHALMPARATMGALRLVDIGVGAVAGAAQMVMRPLLAAPAADAHKYRRGLLGVVPGAMPGAAVLAALAAQGAGAGYVRVLSGGAGAGAGASTGSARADLAPTSARAGLAPTSAQLGLAPPSARPELVEGPALPPDLVRDDTPLAEALEDGRYGALLVGPGLGRGGAALARLVAVLASPIPAVLDADALVLLAPRLLAERKAPLIATPHEGELVRLERAFACDGSGSKPERAAALARASGMVIVAKGPDTVIAAPGARLALSAGASPWLSVAGTGDVLAGTIASRLAAGADPFAAACEGVWLHGEAARRCPAPFSASQLAASIASAYRACL